MFLLGEKPNYTDGMADLVSENVLEVWVRLTRLQVDERKVEHPGKV